MSLMRQPTILVTGGTGFVGRHVVRLLLTAGTRLKLVVRSNRKFELPASLAKCSLVTTADLFAEDETWWARTCSGVDSIVHLAWYVEPGTYLSSPLNLSCLAGTLAMARGAAQAGVARIVGAGTCAEYDMNAGLLTAETPLRPKTLYAASKAAAFMLLDEWTRLHQIAFAWCRLFYLHGDGEHPSRLVPFLHSRLSAGLTAELSSGEQVRDFINVEDAAQQIADICMGDETGVFNICSGVPVTVRQMAERIADGYGRRDLLGFGMRPNNALDPPVVVGVPHSARPPVANAPTADLITRPSHTTDRPLLYTEAPEKHESRVAEDLE
jgi:nucleoside-diphosphate-sugar epimerase